MQTTWLIDTWQYPVHRILVEISCMHFVCSINKTEYYNKLIINILRYRILKSVQCLAPGPKV